MRPYVSLWVLLILIGPNVCLWVLVGLCLPFLVFIGPSRS